MATDYGNMKKKADKVFSKYIRHKYADENGYVECVCCGVKKPINEMQNGHFISRGKLSTRYEESNCHPCCVGCNVFKKGNYPAYSEYMANRYGAWIFAELRVMSEKITKWKAHDYEDMIKVWKEKIKGKGEVIP